MRAITNWRVVEHDRVAGTLVDTDGGIDGRTIVTSKVVCIKIAGRPPCPVAFTATGSRYLLGQPDRRAYEAPEQFVTRKMEERAVDTNDDGEQTAYTPAR